MTEDDMMTSRTGQDAPENSDRMHRHNSQRMHTPAYLFCIWPRHKQVEQQDVLRQVVPGGSQEAVPRGIKVDTCKLHQGCGKGVECHYPVRDWGILGRCQDHIGCYQHQNDTCDDWCQPRPLNTRFSPLVLPESTAKGHPAAGHTHTIQPFSTNFQAKGGRSM